MWIFRRTNTLWQDILNICHYDKWANESRPERVRLFVHTTEPTGTVPLRSHREVVGSFRNDWTQWNRCEHGCPVAFRNHSGPKALVSLARTPLLRSCCLILCRFWLCRRGEPGRVSPKDSTVKIMLSDPVQVLVMWM